MRDTFRAASDSTAAYESPYTDDVRYIHNCILTMNPQKEFHLRLNDITPSTPNAQVLTSSPNTPRKEYIKIVHPMSPLSPRNLFPSPSILHRILNTPMRTGSGSTTNLKRMISKPSNSKQATLFNNVKIHTDSPLLREYHVNDTIETFYNMLYNAHLYYKVKLMKAYPLDIKLIWDVKNRSSKPKKRVLTQPKDNCWSFSIWQLIRDCVPLYQRCVKIHPILNALFMEENADAALSFNYEGLLLSYSDLALQTTPWKDQDAKYSFFSDYGYADCFLAAILKICGLTCRLNEMEYVDQLNINVTPVRNDADVLTVRRLETKEGSQHLLHDLQFPREAWGGIIHVCSVKTCAPETWHFVSFTCDNGELTIYDTADGSKETGIRKIKGKYKHYKIVHLYVVFLNVVGVPDVVPNDGV